MKTTRSLYLTLGLIIVCSVIIINSINASISYTQTKDKLLTDMKESSRATIVSLQKNIANYMKSYAINEYDKLISNEIAQRDIYSIVVEDNNMGKILGQPAYILGKIKTASGEIIDYEENNKEQKKSLEQSFYSDSYEINDKEQFLGKVTIYMSDTTLNKELNKIIEQSTKNTILFSILLIFSLFLAIRYFVLEPISNIITTINDRDEDGIPKSALKHHQAKEIDELSTTMNTMIDSVKASQSILKNREEELYKALQLQTTIFDTSSYIMIRVNKNGLIQQINKEAERVLGYKAKEIINKFTPEIFHQKSQVVSRAKFLEEHYKMKIEKGMDVFIALSDKGIKTEQEWTYVTKDGKHIPVNLSVSTLKDELGETYGYLGIAQDISERKLLESQAKLASMGEMMGNIAHQWRQPLSVISTIASGLRVRNAIETLSTKELDTSMESISQQTQYLSHTIDDFRNFIKSNNNKELLSIVESLKQALTIVTPSLKNNTIVLHEKLDADLDFEGYHNQLVQVFINIINNAKDAIKEHMGEDKRYIFIQTKRNPKGLVVTIKDNGGGIENSIISRIFEPYFTTKHQTVGTGIGLSMVHQIITENHQADIEVFNETYTYEEQAYVGACFQITFPL